MDGRLGEKEATLHKRVEKEAEPSSADSGDESIENGVVLGVDLNEDGYLAVTSTGAFYGNADYLTHKREKYEHRRGNPQQRGTRSAHLTINSIVSRLARWSADYLHRVSKAIVHEAVENDCTAVAFEKLKHIGERISNNSKFQQWAFCELQRQVEYKAKEYRIDVDDVAPQYTSQRYSHGECGFTHEDNRDVDEFECPKCGKELQADYNATRRMASCSALAHVWCWTGQESTDPEVRDGEREWRVHTFRVVRIERESTDRPRGLTPRRLTNPARPVTLADPTKRSLDTDILNVGACDDRRFSGPPIPHNRQSSGWSLILDGLRWLPVRFF